MRGRTLSTGMGAPDCKARDEADSSELQGLTYILEILAVPKEGPRARVFGDDLPLSGAESNVWSSLTGFQ